MPAPDAGQHTDEILAELGYSDRWRQPEALYFGAVAAYKLANDPARLADGWTQLMNDFPDSDWAKKAEFIRK